MMNRFLARFRGIDDVAERAADIRARLIYPIGDDNRSEDNEPWVWKQWSRTAESARWAAAASRRSLVVSSSLVARLAIVAWALARRLFLASGPAMSALAAGAAAGFRSVAALSRSIRAILQRSRVRWDHAVAVVLFGIVTGITVVTAHKLLEMAPTLWSRESAAAPSGAEPKENTSSTDSPGIAPAIATRAPQASGRATASQETPRPLTAQRPSSSPAVASKSRPTVAQPSQQPVAAQARTAPVPRQRATSPATGVPALGAVLSVASDPSGAEVYVDGRKLVGRTPMAVSGLPTGAHVLRIALDGYDGWTEGVQLVSDQTTRILVRMQPAGK